MGDGGPPPTAGRATRELQNDRTGRPARQWPTIGLEDLPPALAQHGPVHVEPIGTRTPARPSKALNARSSASAGNPQLESPRDRRRARNQPHDTLQENETPRSENRATRWPRMGQRIAVSGQRSAVRASEFFEWGCQEPLRGRRFIANRDFRQRSPRLQTAALLATAEPLNDEAIWAAELTSRHPRPAQPTLPPESAEHAGARSATQSGAPCGKPTDN